MHLPLPLLFALIGGLGFAQDLPHKVVLLDGYHNDETKNPLHYRWEGTDNGGFSKLGSVLKGMGAELRTATSQIDEKTLAGVGCLIIVDPDTPAESDHPHYIADDEIDAITRWVRTGGRLALLGNDKGNAEFQHLNRLAANFGIEFVEDTIPKVKGKGILKIQGQGTIFQGAPRFYAVELAPLRITRTEGVDQLLTYDGSPVMVLVHEGQGLVFALGDPWMYNEYIGRDNNEEIARKLFSRLLK